MNSVSKSATALPLSSAAIWLPAAGCMSILPRRWRFGPSWSPEAEGCRERSIGEWLHKYRAPEHRALARAALAHTGQGRSLQCNSIAPSMARAQDASARGASRSCTCANACTSAPHLHTGRNHVPRLHAQGRSAISHVGSRATQSRRLRSSRKAGSRTVLGRRMWAC